MPDTLPAAFAGLTTARPEEIGLKRAALQRLTAAMEREIAAGRAPGVSMLIARHGKVGFAQGLGALRPGGPPMPEDAIFRIYSMTKPIVSVAAMTLVEEGRLLINDPVSKYIPAFAEMKVGV
jgi:CubicO group peptidase (beta-lactamase class C family)